MLCFFFVLLLLLFLRALFFFSIYRIIMSSARKRGFYLYSNGKIRRLADVKQPDQQHDPEEPGQQHDPEAPNPKRQKPNDDDDLKEEVDALDRALIAADVPAIPAIPAIPAAGSSAAVPVPEPVPSVPPPSSPPRNEQQAPAVQSAQEIPPDALAIIDPGSLPLPPPPRPPRPRPPPDEKQQLPPVRLSQGIPVQFASVSDPPRPVPSLAGVSLLGNNPPERSAPSAPLASSSAADLKRVRRLEKRINELLDATQREYIEQTKGDMKVYFESLEQMLIADRVAAAEQENLFLQRAEHSRRDFLNGARRLLDQNNGTTLREVYRHVSDVSNRRPVQQSSLSGSGARPPAPSPPSPPPSPPPPPSRADNAAEADAFRRFLERIVEEYENQRAENKMGLGFIHEQVRTKLGRMAQNLEVVQRAAEFIVNSFDEIKEDNRTAFNSLRTRIGWADQVAAVRAGVGGRGNNAQDNAECKDLAREMKRLADNLVGIRRENKTGLENVITAAARLGDRKTRPVNGDECKELAEELEKLRKDLAKAQTKNADELKKIKQAIKPTVASRSDQKTRVVDSGECKDLKKKVDNLANQLKTIGDRNRAELKNIQAACKTPDRKGAAGRDDGECKKLKETVDRLLIRMTQFREKHSGEMRGLKEALKGRGPGGGRGGGGGGGGAGGGGGRGGRSSSDIRRIEELEELLDKYRSLIERAFAFMQFAITASAYPEKDIDLNRLPMSGFLQDMGRVVALMSDEDHVETLESAMVRLTRDLTDEKVWKNASVAKWVFDIESGAWQSGVDVKPADPNNEDTLMDKIRDLLAKYLNQFRLYFDPVDALDPAVVAVPRFTKVRNGWAEIGQGMVAFAGRLSTAFLQIGSVLQFRQKNKMLSDETAAVFQVQVELQRLHKELRQQITQVSQRMYDEWKTNLDQLRATWESTNEVLQKYSTHILKESILEVANSDRPNPRAAVAVAVAAAVPNDAKIPISQPSAPDFFLRWAATLKRIAARTALPVSASAAGNEFISALRTAATTAIDEQVQMLTGVAWRRFATKVSFNIRDMISRLSTVANMQNRMNPLMQLDTDQLMREDIDAADLQNMEKHVQDVVTKVVDTFVQIQKEGGSMERVMKMTIECDALKETKRHLEQAIQRCTPLMERSYNHLLAFRTSFVSSDIKELAVEMEDYNAQTAAFVQLCKQVERISDSLSRASIHVRGLVTTFNEILHSYDMSLNVMFLTPEAVTVFQQLAHHVIGSQVITRLVHRAMHSPGSVYSHNAIQTLVVHTGELADVIQLAARITLPPETKFAPTELQTVITHLRSFETKFSSLSDDARDFMKSQRVAQLDLTGRVARLTADWEKAKELLKLVDSHPLLVLLADLQPERKNVYKSALDNADVIVSAASGAHILTGDATIKGLVKWSRDAFKNMETRLEETKVLYRNLDQLSGVIPQSLHPLLKGSNVIPKFANADFRAPRMNEANTFLVELYQLFAGSQLTAALVALSDTKVAGAAGVGVGATGASSAYSEMSIMGANPTTLENAIRYLTPVEDDTVDGHRLPPIPLYDAAILLASMVAGEIGLSTAHFLDLTFFVEPKRLSATQAHAQAIPLLTTGAYQFTAEAKNMIRIAHERKKVTLFPPERVLYSPALRAPLEEVMLRLTSALHCKCTLSRLLKLVLTERHPHLLTHLRMCITSVVIMNMIKSQVLPYNERLSQARARGRGAMVNRPQQELTWQVHTATEEEYNILIRRFVEMYGDLFEVETNYV